MSNLQRGVKRLIESRAPTRIDLAGGTLDIWPLYLFLKDPMTLNLGIDLYAQARIEELEPTASSNEPGEVVLRSEDQEAELRFNWETIGTALAPPSLSLHHKLFLHFLEKRRKANFQDPKMGFRLTTAAKSPAGAGLGGSSALSVAMIGALASWASSPSDAESTVNPKDNGLSWIEIIRDIETTVIRVPAGLQDYYGAMFGGLQSLRWTPGLHEREWLPATVVEGLEKRLLLFYSGQSRNSGINNWALYKAFIDNQGKVRAQFQAIAEATRKLEEALRKSDWEAAGAMIAEEWETRRTLADGISTQEIDFAFNIAKKMGAPAGKICGAGGGGCFFIYLSSDDPELNAKVRKKISALGLRSLPFKSSPRGLEIKISRA